MTEPIVGNFALFPFDVWQDPETLLFWVVLTGGHRELELGSYVTLLRGSQDENGIGDLKVVKLRRGTIAEFCDDELDEALPESAQHPDLAEILGAATVEGGFFRMAGAYKTGYGPNSNFIVLGLEAAPLVQEKAPEPKGKK